MVLSCISFFGCPPLALVTYPVGMTGIGLFRFFTWAPCKWGDTYEKESYHLQDLQDWTKFRLEEPIGPYYGAYPDPSLYSRLYGSHDKIREKLDVLMSNDAWKTMSKNVLFSKVQER
jgi:hypothetical protein